MISNRIRQPSKDIQKWRPIFPTRVQLPQRLSALNLIEGLLNTTSKNFSPKNRRQNSVSSGGIENLSI